MNAKAKRIVIDHCSFSWATDELVQSRANDVTFRHNLFSECLATNKHHKGTHSKALIILDQGPKDRVDEDAASRVTWRSSATCLHTMATATRSHRREYGGSDQ